MVKVDERADQPPGNEVVAGVEGGEERGVQPRNHRGEDGVSEVADRALHESVGSQDRPALGEDVLAHPQPQRALGVGGNLHDGSGDQPGKHRGDQVETHEVPLVTGSPTGGRAAASVAGPGGVASRSASLQERGTQREARPERECHGVLSGSDRLQSLQDEEHRCR